MKRPGHTKPIIHFAVNYRHNLRASLCTSFAGLHCVDGGHPQSAPDRRRAAGVRTAFRVSLIMVHIDGATDY